MKRILPTVVNTAIVCSVLLSSSVFADDSNNASTLDSDWSFGLQAAPLIFGLSVRYHVTDEWQMQGVVMPSGDDFSVAFRALRTSTQKEFWRSYLFGGVAMATNDGYGLGPDGDFYEDTRDIALTAGLGVEWAWAAKNPSLPPLTWSLELGLGIGEDNYGSSEFDSDQTAFLAAGASIHYQFE